MDQAQQDDGEWITSWAGENGSAVDIWGDEALQTRVKDIVAAGGVVKPVMLEPAESYFSRGEDDVLRQLADKEVAKWAAKGFVEIGFCDNMDQGEVLLAKLPDWRASQDPDQIIRAFPKNASTDDKLDLFRLAQRLRSNKLNAFVHQLRLEHRPQSHVRKMIEQFVPETEDWEKKVVGIVQQLQQLGFEVISDDNSHSVRMKITDDPEGPATNLVTGEPAGVKFMMPDEHDPDEGLDYATYEVYPKKNWIKFVERCERSGKRELWTDYSQQRGDQFEEILQKAGFELGGAGGHPPNFDFGFTFGTMHVNFNFWGNPYHL